MYTELRLSITLLFVSPFSAASSPFASAGEFLPCPGLGSISVDSKYKPRPDGAYCLIRNESNGTFNFGPKTQGSRFPVADPSILRIGDSYFVVGTSDDTGNINFIIYRSENLVDWSIHGQVFDPSLYRLEPFDDDPTRFQPMIELGPGRKFCDLWAAQFVQDPRDPNRLAVTFTALEDGNARLCHQRDWNARILWNSVFRTTLSLEDLQAGRGASDIRSFGYTIGNAPVGPNGEEFRQDSGAALGRPIPSTPSKDFLGPNPSDYSSHGGRACSNRFGCAPAMGIDSGIYFDANDSYRPWVFYSWFDMVGGHTLHGSHIAGHPLLDDLFRLDASPSFSLRPFAFKSNRSSAERIQYARKWIDNGLMGPTGPMFDSLNQYAEMPKAYGIAEGPGVFFWKQRPYFYFSRNSFDSAAYGIFYRIGSTRASLRSLALSKWDDAKVSEFALIKSSQRSVDRGVSYGHGELFVGPGGRPFAIFHKKNSNSYDRTPYFKELTVESNGRFKVLSDDPRTPAAQNLGAFLIPRPAR